MTLGVTIKVDSRLLVAKLKRMKTKIGVVGPRLAGTASRSIARKWKAGISQGAQGHSFSFTGKSIKSIRSTRKRKGMWEVSGDSPWLTPMEFGTFPHTVSLEGEAMKWVMTKLMRINPGAARKILARGWMTVGKGHLGSAFVPGGRKLLAKAISRTIKDMRPVYKQGLKEIVKV